MVKNYIPDKGDVIWLSFDPTRGREQRGTRPGIVVSSRSFNQKSGLSYICPITSTEKNYPYRIKIIGNKVSGFVTVEHMRSVDWKDRKIIFVERASPAILESIKRCIEAIVE